MLPFVQQDKTAGYCTYPICFCHSEQSEKSPSKTIRIKNCDKRKIIIFTPANKLTMPLKISNQMRQTGMYCYGARYYTPEVSIWLSVDPLADKYPSMSPYMYCAGNPVRLIDPDGRSLGDYFDRLGNYLGNDGKEDGKVYLLNEGLRAKTENKNVNWGGKLN